MQFAEFIVTGESLMPMLAIYIAVPLGILIVVIVITVVACVLCKRFRYSALHNDVIILSLLFNFR